MSYLMHTISPILSTRKVDITMTITLSAKPLTINVRIDGYGEFRLTHLGAGTKAEMRRRLGEASDASEAVNKKYKSLIEKEQQLLSDGLVDDLEQLKQSPKYIEAQEEFANCTRRLEQAQDFAAHALLSLWDSDDKAALNKLFKDLTMAQIKDLYNQALQIESNHQEEYV